jgi:hypothetical protein
MPEFIMMLFFFVIYIGITIYILVLMTRFVQAHERIAGSLERREIAYDQKQ